MYMRMPPLIQREGRIYESKLVYPCLILTCDVFGSELRWPDYAEPSMNL